MHPSVFPRCEIGALSPPIIQQHKVVAKRICITLKQAWLFPRPRNDGSYSPVRRHVSIICIKISCVSAAALSKEAYKVLKNKSRHSSYLYVFTWKGREEKGNSFFPFFTTAKPFSFILHFEIERLWKDWNEAKANTGSKQEKTQVPFPIVEKTVSLSLHNKKGQICSSITSNLFHQLHPK